jgi:hypothetical protein
MISVLSFFFMAGLAPAHEPVTVSIGGHRFQVEVAESNKEITRGLMYRERLGKFQGMLFVFPDEQPRSFWMKNTLIPLDIIFISSSSRIVSISERAEPLTLTSRESKGPARYVLEINGGLSSELKIRPGIKVKIEGLKAAQVPSNSGVR